jgi:hypothetical protein
VASDRRSPSFAGIRKGWATLKYGCSVALDRYKRRNQEARSKDRPLRKREFADAGDFEDGAFAAFGRFDGSEAAAGGDVFVGERFEFGGGGIDFDGLCGVGVDREFRVEFDGPAGGFAADGHGAGEFAGDGDGLRGLGVGGLGKCVDRREEKNRD